MHRSLAIASSTPRSLTFPISVGPSQLLLSIQTSAQFHFRFYIVRYDHPIIIILYLKYEKPSLNLAPSLAHNLHSLYLALDLIFIVKAVPGLSLDSQKTLNKIVVTHKQVGTEEKRKTGVNRDDFVPHVTFTEHNSIVNGKLQLWSKGSIYICPAINRPRRAQT